MKTFLFSRRFRNGWMAAAISVCLNGTAFAQLGAYYQTSDTSTKRAWRLHTDPQTRSTIVRFYSPEKRLLYEEVIPGQYVKLTSRNVRMLDETLARLTDNRLMQDKLKSSELAVDYRKPSFAGHPETGSSVSVASLQAVAYPRANPAKLRVVFVNPAMEYVVVKITDERNRIIYVERIRPSKYQRDFDFSTAKAGSYTLTVHGKQYAYSRQITWQRRMDMQLQIDPVIMPIAAHNQNTDTIRRDAIK